MSQEDFTVAADGWTADDLAELEQDHPTNTCNGFAFSYLEANPNHDVVVADGLWERTPSAHCFVIDRTLGVVIDMTLSQFMPETFGAVWDGQTHPHIDDLEEVREWSDRDEFEAHYGEQQHPDFIV